MQKRKVFSIAMSAAAVLTIGNAVIPSLKSPVMANNHCQCRDKRIKNGETRCDTKSGKNSYQKAYCEQCGWEYINTGAMSFESNYCLAN